MLVRVLAVVFTLFTVPVPVCAAQTLWMLVRVLAVSLYFSLFLYQFVPHTRDGCWLGFSLCLCIFPCSSVVCV